MFIADIYRHPETRVWVAANSAIAGAWIGASLRRLLPPDRVMYGPYTFDATEARYDIVVTQTSEIEQYADWHELANEYLVEIRTDKNQYRGEREFYTLHLPRDLAPINVYKEINS